ncbi:MAG: hypothetical protein HYW71_00075 [Candidatus Niyogibacteria bacterium]|nr:hypothetical protein [Candidatus Niyogibacteria bacterium]
MRQYELEDVKAYTRSFLGVICVGFLFILFSLIFRLIFVNFVDNYEIGYRYETFGENAGKVSALSRTGYFITWPFKTKIHTIDGRPMQVCISSINRVLNCKLVQFNPKGVDLFISWHGRGNYDNVSTTHGPSLLNQILMAYAYEGSGKEYPFLTIIRELKPSEIQIQEVKK